LNTKILLKIKINVDAAKTPTVKKKKSDFPKSNQAVDEKVSEKQAFKELVCFG
jgi:hypothetical protein